MAKGPKLKVTQYFLFFRNLVFINEFLCLSLLLALNTNEKGIQEVAMIFLPT